MKEYEYSFKVKNINPYIEYCIKNNFEKISCEEQIRKLYINKNKVLARLTIKTVDGNTVTILDFKDENDTEVILKESRETKPLYVSNDSEEAIYSILDILNYSLNKILKRTRIIYKKDLVKFEIDEYMEPERCFVVAIEGEKIVVDKVYKELEKNILNEAKE